MNEDEAWDEIERRQLRQKPKPVIDYSESMIKLTALTLQYRKLVYKQNYDLAINCAVEMQFMAIQLQEWAEQQEWTKKQNEP